LPVAVSSVGTWLTPSLKSHLSVRIVACADRHTRVGDTQTIVS